MEKFTKGSWFATFTRDLSLFVCVGEDHHMIASVDTCNPYDAHLIAAAPDLYEVAVDALKVVELLSDGDEKEGGLTQRLRAALAKARGEESK